MYGGVFQQGGVNPLQFAPDNYGDQGGGGQGDLAGTATVKEKKMDFQKSGPGAAGWAEIGLAGARALASTVDFLKNKEDDIGSMTSADKVFASKKQDPRQLGMDYTFNPMGIASNPVLAQQASKFGNAYNVAKYGGHFQDGGPSQPRVQPRDMEAENEFERSRHNLLMETDPSYFFSNDYAITNRRLNPDAYSFNPDAYSGDRAEWDGYIPSHVIDSLKKNFQMGGEYEMSDAEIAQFLAMGGQIEYVD